MLLAGTRSSVHSSPTLETSPAHQPGKRRAGIAIALVVLTLMMGLGRPAATTAYAPKSDSMACEAIDAGARWVGDKMIAAQRAGDTQAVKHWNTVFASLESLYFGLDCQHSYN